MPRAERVHRGRVTDVPGTSPTGRRSPAQRAVRRSPGCGHERRRGGLGAVPVTPLEFGLLVLAGVGAGLTGSIAGLASLISYPALLATGVPPVTANVTNTVALVLNSVGSVSASRPGAARARRRRLRPARRRRGPRRRGRRRPAAAHAGGGLRADRAVADRRRVGRDPGAAAAARARRRGHAGAPASPATPGGCRRHLRHRHLRRLLRRGRRRADAGRCTCSAPARACPAATR